MLPDFIRAKFTAVLAGYLPLAEFEQWLYATPELETALPPDDYLELISLNYKGRDATQEVEILLSRHIDWSDLRRDELLCTLRSITLHSAPDTLFAAFVSCYDWYCRGCLFLEVLGLDFGLRVDDEYGWGGSMGKWQNLTEAAKQQYLSSYFPAAQYEAEQVIGWLTAGLIRFDNEPYPSGEDRVGYTDLRPDTP
ncbi:hypothetical protein [Hymenobacter jeollabukensis]|uniref:Uncharacterized protein n=1 Tax=Hymenobacter jeollabukensis TaxID=2025313 RepID=A0A5R8WUP8_9BACT|nr:hypothetical protein [Hymenobacter jeollabukensis]TLM95223.1 hypothetical protein FDY95_05400 [Hymenobacter jeollabukensis]